MAKIMVEEKQKRQLIDIQKVTKIKSCTLILSRNKRRERKTKRNKNEKQRQTSTKLEYKQNKPYQYHLYTMPLYFSFLKQL